MSSSRKISKKSVKPFGLLSGWAELAFSVPPPFVPTCLIASWLAKGPPEMTCWAPSTVCAIVLPCRFWIAPWLTKIERGDDRQRQQDAHRGADQVDPEVADRVLSATRQPPDEGDDDGDADGRRREVLDGETDHLGEMAHRHLGRVVLPVRVRHEADRRVPGQRRRHRIHAGRVERQRTLDPLQQVQEEHAGGAERQQRHGVGAPALLTTVIDADDLVDQALDRGEEALAGGGGRALVRRREHPRHVAAEERDADDEGDDHQDDGDQGLGGHQSFSGKRRATTR